jgi:methyl-accepting chemotaxis protein
MDSVTQSNAANAEESASAAEELSAQAEQLGQMVVELQGVVGGSTGTTDASADFQTDHEHLTLQRSPQTPKAQPSKATPKRAAETVASTSNEEAFPMDDDDAGLATF